MYSLYVVIDHSVCRGNDVQKYVFALFCFMFKKMCCKETITIFVSPRVHALSSDNKVSGIVIMFEKVQPLNELQPQYDKR